MEVLAVSEAREVLVALDPTDPTVLGQPVPRALMDHGPAIQAT